MKAHKQDERDQVAPGSECPKCGETRMDWLVWQEDEAGEYVRCATCGTEYFPGREDR